MSNSIENVTPEQWANAERITLTHNVVIRHEGGMQYARIVRSAAADD